MTVYNFILFGPYCTKEVYGMKRIGMILLLVVMLTGCAKKEVLPAHRVVTGIQVEYRQGDQLLERTYTRPENIRAVLNYLRILKPHGPVIPEEGNGNGCRITLRYSSGPDTVYLQNSNAYLSRNHGQWATIDEKRAPLLYPLLLLLPSDA